MCRWDRSQSTPFEIELTALALDLAVAYGRRGSLHARLHCANAPGRMCCPPVAPGVVASCHWQPPPSPSTRNVSRPAYKRLRLRASRLSAKHSSPALCSPAAASATASAAGGLGRLPPRCERRKHLPVRRGQPHGPVTGVNEHHRGSALCADKIISTAAAAGGLPHDRVPHHQPRRRHLRIARRAAGGAQRSR